MTDIQFYLMFGAMNIIVAYVAYQLGTLKDVFTNVDKTVDCISTPCCALYYYQVNQAYDQGFIYNSGNKTTIRLVKGCTYRDYCKSTGCCVEGCLHKLPGIKLSEPR